MSRPLLRGVKEIVVSLDLLHNRSQCAREVLRRLSSKKLRTPDMTVRNEIRPGQHPTITVNFMEDGRTMQLDAVKYNANEVFQAIQDEIIRAENWKETVMFRPSLEKQGLL